jgi:ACS family tartrate transporter-like MFS transporter
MAINVNEISSHSSGSQITRRVMPLLLTVWFVAYLDRFNISIAALQMNRDLGLSPSAFGFAAGVFFLGYSVFELPSNLMLARFGARRWLARILITWGTVACAMAFVRDARSLHFLRFMLGAAEAGCFPGMAYYLSRVLPLRERALAFAQLAAVTQVAVIVGGPLAGWLLALNGRGGLAGWQWLFFIEGTPAIILAFGVLKWLPEDIDAFSSLSAAERLHLAASLDKPAVHESAVTAVRRVLRDRRLLAWAAVFFTYNLGSAGLRIWQPTMLRQLTNASDLAVATLSVIPAIAGLSAIWAVGYSSKLMAERRWHIAVPLVCGVVGLTLVAFSASVVWCVAAASLATVAIACQPPLFASVTAVSDGTTRAAAVALVNSLAMTGSFVGPYVIGYLQAATSSFRTPYLLLAAVLCAGTLLNIATRESTGRLRIR